MKALSKRQQEVLEFLRSFSSSCGMAPSVSEIAEHFGVAPSTVSGHLEVLRKKRFLTRSSRARSIVLTERGSADPVLKIPVYGKLVSAELEENEAYRESVVCLHRSEARGFSADRLFALRIPDESLNGLGIYCGDAAIFAPADELPPRLGDVAAVLRGDGVLVRCCFPRGNGEIVTLRAAHPGVPELELKRDELRVVGVLIYLQRRYSR